MQEPFAAAAKIKIAFSVKGYHSEVTTAMTGLLAYVKITLPHKLVQFHNLEIQTDWIFFTL